MDMQALNKLIARAMRMIQTTVNEFVQDQLRAVVRLLNEARRALKKGDEYWASERVIFAVQRVQLARRYA